MLRFVIYVLIILALVLNGQTIAQNRFLLDRYELSAAGLNQVSLEFKNESFSFNRITLEAAIQAGIVIESIIIRTSGGESDLWLTMDSTLFQGAGNSQTALIRKSDKHLTVDFFKEIVAGDNVRILFNFSIPKLLHKDSRKADEDLLWITLSHASFSERQKKLLPAQRLTVK